MGSWEGTAWRYIPDRQATPVDFTNFWNFIMNCLAVMINRQATRVSVSDFGIFWVQG